MAATKTRQPITFPVMRQRIEVAAIQHDDLVQVSGGRFGRGLCGESVADYFPELEGKRIARAWFTIHFSDAKDRVPFVFHWRPVRWGYAPFSCYVKDEWGHIPRCSHALIEWGHIKGLRDGDEIFVSCEYIER